MSEDHFDVILVGSGTCGATIARELVRKNQKVLILEKGANHPLRETLGGLAAIAREIAVGERLNALTAITAGGSTSLYLSVCKLPTPETFEKLGIDLSEELEEVKREVPIAELPDDFLQPQSRLIRDSAGDMGFPMTKNLMMIDQSKCASGSYSYEAKWKAKSYLDEAVAGGATLVTKADVKKVIVENGEAVGVEYKHKTGVRSRTIRVYGKKTVLCAGALFTPKLLMDCGIKGIGSRGFFCKPVFMVCGIVPGLRGKDAFVGSFDIDDTGEGVSLGDSTMNSTMFKLTMLSNLKLRYLFSHSKAVAVGVLIKDRPGGEVRPDGSLYKRLSNEELDKMKSAEAVAAKIVRNAGGNNIFRTRPVAGIPGGLLRIGEHLDANMQTSINNLYVCDHSVINDEKITPTVTLLCLAKYLAGRLAPSSSPVSG